MIDNIARRTVLRLGLLAVSALGAGRAVAGTEQSGGTPGAFSGTPAQPSLDDELKRLWRYAGEFGGTSGTRYSKGKEE